MIVALAGGVGGAKLVHGLARALAPEELVVVVNTGDDFQHLGVHICPDLDTVMYTLAGAANPRTGWGLKDETWSFMEGMQALGGPTWFKLGDRDLATHVQRTQLLRSGQTLSDVTHLLCKSMGIEHPVVPMSDEPVRTIVRTSDADLDFQHYFVRERCEPIVTSFDYRGAATARMAPRFADSLSAPDLEAIIICPSNPYLSIGPILSIPGVRKAMRRCAKVYAVSPIVGGMALKGPAAKIMREMGEDVSALGVAKHYGDVIDALIIDHSDETLRTRIERMDIRVVSEDIVMRSEQDRTRLAESCLAAIRSP
jgi:LPPG:FO 2-phospho-L-lactate transferase